MPWLVEHGIRCKSSHRRVLAGVSGLLDHQREAAENGGGKAEPIVRAGPSPARRPGLVADGLSQAAFTDEPNADSRLRLGANRRRRNLCRRTPGLHLGASHFGRQLEQRRHLQAGPRTGPHGAVSVRPASHLHRLAADEPRHGRGSWPAALLVEHPHHGRRLLDQTQTGRTAVAPAFSRPISRLQETSESHRALHPLKIRKPGSHEMEFTARDAQELTRRAARRIINAKGL